MPERRKKEQNEECWVGFLGGGDVTIDNATSLLDDHLFPQHIYAEDFHILMPDEIKRTQTGLTNVRKAVHDGLGLEIEYITPKGIVKQLAERVTDSQCQVYLVVLYNDEDSLNDLIEDALERGIKVKDLCSALDDVELPEDEPAELHGEPRSTEGKVVEVKVEGPAIVAPMAVNTATGAIVPGEGVLYRAIRRIIEEVLDDMGLIPGHNAHMDVPEQDEKIRAFVDDDGNYEVAPAGAKKAPRGKRTVNLTKDQAKEVGLK